MADFSGLPLPLAAGAFLASAVVIALFGWKMTRQADVIADVTGLGEALMGALFLGGSTSLSGIVTSVTAAWQGYAELAISNAMGGIAAQTAFLAIADIAYRKANLEHAAASGANLIQGALLLTLLSIPVAAMSAPQVTVWGVHPASVLLIATYVLGLRLVSRARTEPMWTPRLTRETKQDKVRTVRMERPELVALWLRFAFFGAAVCVAGYVVAESAIAMVSQAGISETVAGGILTAVATSLPELVTSVSAVRQGALTLAVGGVIGGNCFDVLFAAFSDFAYRGGSVYGALAEEQLFMVSVTMLLTGILLLGLLRREKYGIGNIGFESFLIIAVYASAFALLFFAG